MELFSYLLKVSAGLVLFFAFYLLVLQKLTFFKFNRFYLLGTLIVSFVIPTLHFTIEREVQPVHEMALVTSLSNIENLQAVHNEQMVDLPKGFQPEKITGQQIDWLALLPYVYIIIAALLLLIGIRKLVVLVRYTRQNAKSIDGLKLLQKNEGFTNCSFFNYVFINGSNLASQELAALLNHEKVHAQQYHSVDKIIMMIAKSIMWFNPVIYLWDKALEQTHEYEADEATADHFGSKDYASLLLKLAVSESQTTLVHNFVKSPIKERIKMLFSTKSNKMKKLMYLMVVPIILGITWGFTIEVVNVVPSKAPLKQNENTQDDPLIGKTIKGRVDSISKQGFPRILYLKVGNTTYPIRHDIPYQIKVGDELTVTISGKIQKLSIKNLAKNEELIYDTPIYMVNAAATPTGKSLMKAPEKHAFLYEANRARFAHSNIKSIKRNSAGYVNEIELNDGTFKILLNVSALKTKAENFKTGDAVTVKFIGEKLISKNVYATNKLIALYTNPKKHELIDPALYAKFYTKEGFQKIAGGPQKPLKITPVSEDEVKVVSAANAIGNVSSGTSYLKKAKLQIGKIVIEAEEASLDSRNRIMFAENAKVHFADGKVKVYQTVIYNINKKTYDFYEFVKNEDKASIISGPGKEGALSFSKDVALSKIEWSASDSVKSTKIFNNLMLSGKAKIALEKYKAEGKVIFLDDSNKKMIIYFGSLKDDANLKVEAEVIEVDLMANIYKTKIWQR